MLGDRQHAGLGRVEDLAGLAAIGLEAVVDDAGADFDQLPQHGLVAHDLGIGDDVGGRGRGAGQFDQVGAAGDLFGLAHRFKPLAQLHRVVGAVLLREFADGAVDQLVVATIEILVGEDVGDAVEGVGRKHQSAEHRLFGLHRLRRHPQLLDAAVGARLPMERRRIGTEPLARAHQ